MEKAHVVLPLEQYEELKRKADSIEGEEAKRKVAVLKNLLAQVLANINSPAGNNPATLMRLFQDYGVVYSNTREGGVTIDF